MTVWFVSGAAGLPGWCIAKVLASHLFSAQGSWAGENQFFIASNIVAVVYSEKWNLFSEKERKKRE